MDRGLMALFAGVCVTALATGGRTELPELRAEQVLLSGVHVCPGYCVSCAGGNSGHVAAASPPECSAGGCDNPDANAGTDGWHSSCAGVNTCQSHSCNGGDADAAAEEAAMHTQDLHRAVGRAILDGDATRLADLMASNPHRLHYEPSRTALQVVACDGEITAHYPLSAGLATRLED